MSDHSSSAQSASSSPIDPLEAMCAAHAPVRTEGRYSAGAVFGDWRVTAFIGRGGSGEVYCAEHVALGTSAAVKVLVRDEARAKARFEREARLLSELKLASFPRFLAYGEANGCAYLAMELLEPGGLPAGDRDVARFLLQVCDGVAELHARGLVHRDIKPGNIRVLNRVPFRADLGLVKKRGTMVSDPIVRHGRGISIIDGKPVGVGTLDYAAPEQLLKGEASVQSDVFALGKILRALYEGRPPASVKPIIRKATRELPGDRYESADEFASALRHRNYFRLFLGVMLLVAVAAGLVALGHLDDLRRWAGKRFNAPPRVLTVAKAHDESYAAYFARLKQLATDGSPVAQCALAEAYMYGQGTATNLEEAVRWYRTAAAAGNSDAQASLGLCLLRGWGCEKDVKGAIEWYTRAAEQKNLSAMNDLAFCRLHGIGVEKDSEGGFALALEAAKNGHAPAQALVGECYLGGIGVEQDIAAAETWLYRAARLGNKRAKHLLESR